MSQVKVYLAGPMSGLEEFNFPAFRAATLDLRARGYEVWSPAEADEELDGFDGVKGETYPFGHYMSRDLPEVLRADLVVVLPGWESSKGARLEIYVAEQCGIKVVSYPEMGPLRHDSSQRFHETLHKLAITHDRKSRDYGTSVDPLANIRACESALGVPAFVGAEIRVADKTQRIASFIQKGELANESVEDSVLDRAVYSVIQLVLLGEG